MSTFTKSVLLWVGGGIAGAVLAPKIATKRKHERLWGALLGAALVGNVGDMWLESQPDYSPPR